MGDDALYSRFLGTWILQPATCDYEQGEPPAEGRYHIEEREGRLYFRIDWKDAGGTSHHAEFSGAPDGQREAFAGGDLADALAVQAVSPRELNSVAYWKGKERMVAQRQLDESGSAMRVVQVVFFPDGSRATNISLYLRQMLN